MAVAYVASLAPTAVNFLAAGEAETVAFNAGTGANRVLIVQVDWRDQTSDITGVTYNGVAMTSLCAKTANGDCAARMYGLANPASGLNNIVVTMGAGSINVDGQISAWSGDGTDQTTPFDTAVTANGSGSTANIVSSATLTTGVTGDRAVFFHSTYNGTAGITATPTNYTERQDLANIALATEFGDADGAASITGSATWSNGAYAVNWVALAVNVNQVSGANNLTWIPVAQSAGASRPSVVASGMTPRGSGA